MNKFHRLYKIREELLAGGMDPNDGLIMDIEALFEDYLTRILEGNVGLKLVENAAFLSDFAEKRLLSVKNDDK